VRIAGPGRMPRFTGGPNESGSALTSMLRVEAGGVRPKSRYRR